MKIEVCQRTMDYWVDETGQSRPKYHAQVKGEGGYWGCGRTTDQAVGNLIMSHPEKFKVEVEYMGKLPR